MKSKHVVNCWHGSARVLFVLLSLLVSALPAAAAFKATLQGRDFGGTNWLGGPLAGYRELDVVQMRILFTGGPANNQTLIISFDHTKGTSRGLENLISFVAGPNVIINSGPTLNSPSGADIWTYTVNVTVTSAADSELRFNAPISAGAHGFGGASLSMSLNSGGGTVQVQKPAVVLGSPDLAITKLGPSEARTNQIITYVINYTNKLIAADTALGVQVIDTLPPEVTYVPGSGSKGVKVVGNTLTWSLGNLPPGRRGLLTYKVMVTNNIPVTTTFANYAQILCSQNDAVPADNAASVTTTVVVIPTPLAEDDYYAIGKNTTLTVPAPGILLNDSNALSATLLSAPVNGTLTFNTNGSFVYIPNTNFLGSDIFAYQSRNSSNVSGPAVVTIDVTNTCFVLSTFTTITNNTPGQCGAAVNFTLPATTGDCAPFDYSPTNGSFFPIGGTTVTFTNTDGVSNVFQVFVLDAESPTINCPSNMVFSTGAGQCSRSNVTFSVTFNDNCPGANVVQNTGLPSGATYPAGVTTNTFTVTDASGNTASCSFTVTIVDSVPPVITCPANIVVAAAPGGCSSNVTFNVTANDGCSGVISVVSVPASGSVFPTGVTTVTNTATDTSGNTSTCTFTVTVLDAQPPTITCPAPVTVTANSGACVATNVNLGTPTAGDNCSVAAVTNNALVNFPVGTNVVTWTVVDNSGNTATCQQTVIVSDNQPPVINCPADVVVAANAGVCVATNVVLGSPSVSDNCGGVTVTNNAPTQFVVGTNIVTWTARDASGNNGTCQQRVVVQDIQPPAINCPTNLVLQADPGQCSRSNVTFTVTASDNCSGVTVVSTPPSGSTFPIGTTTVTNIATDASGNQTMCTFTVNTFSVTINDTEPPVITCPSNLVFAASPGQCGRTNVTFVVTATDNCTVTNLTSTPASGSTFPVGVTTVTNVATDAGGNQAFCSFTVTVTDGQAPTINCPVNMSVTAPPGTTGTNVTFVVNASDACGITNQQSVPASGSFFAAGVTTVTNSATDANGNTSTCTFTITVAVGNSAPVANGQNVSTPEDTALPITLTGSDFDGHPLTYILVSGPTNGALSGFNTNTGALSYRPNTNYTGADAFTFRVNDGFTNSALAVVSITVTPVNDAPLANNQSVSTPEDTALPITLTGSDVEGTPLTFILVSGPSNGSLSGFNTNTGALIYTPATNYNGADSLTFRVSDGTNLSAVATVSITVTPVNDAPLANGQSLSTPEDTALSITLTGSDVEGSPLTFILVSGPANGSVSGFNTNTGVLTYTPATNYTGPDSFTFRVNDGSLNSTVATIAINVTPVNDVPVANGQSVSTPEDTALPITLTGSDVEGGPLTFILVTGPANGSLSGFNTNTGALTYTPATNYNGADSLSFRVSDGTNLSAVATVSITVTPVNDAPLANGQSVSTPEDTALPITLTGSDVEGAALTYILVTGPANGSLSGFNTNTGAVTYQPSTNYIGADSLTFRVTDGTNLSAVATVSITVTPVNDAPFANNQSVSTPEDTARAITLTGSDVEGTPVTFVLVSGPANGSISGFNTNTGALTYTPTTNYHGADSFTFRTSDGTNTSAVATVSITVTPVNDAPIANNDFTGTPRNVPVTINVLANDTDVDGNPLSLVSQSTTNGTLGVAGTNLFFTPASNYVGQVVLSYTITDGSASASALVFVNVTLGTNTPPVANNDAASIPEDSLLTFDPRANDIDADGDLFFISGVVATNGTASVVGGTNISYLPPTNFVGTVSLIYTINDGNGGTASAAIMVTVTPVNDAPFANNQSVSTPEDTALPITLTGSDVEGSPLTFVLVASPANGTVTGFNTNTGVLTYRPNTNYNGADSFTFRVSDGATNSAVATVSITVTPVNDAPFANNQSVSTPEDTALPITLTGLDVEGSPLTFILVSGPANGAVSGFNTNTGALTYTPSTNYTGADSFTFRTSDGANTSAVATVSITVTPVNDAPFANNQSVSTPEDTALPITLTGSDVEGTPLTFILVSGPTNGSLSGFNTNTGVLTYTPNTNYNGADSFTFRVSDGTNNSAVATVSITVMPVADQPRAFSQGLTTPEDTALPITLVGTSPDGNPLTYQLIAAPTHGAFTSLNTNTGVLTYQPATNYNGPDAFTFRVSDGVTNSLVATVSITVTPVNDVPIIVNDVTNTPSGQPVVVSPLVNDINPDGGPLTISCAVTTNGTVVISGTNIIFTSASNFVGTVTVTYCATNQTGGSGSATITVSVTSSSNPTFSVVQGTNWLNPQTGLFEQRVTVTNNSIVTASALRLLVGNINSPQGVPRTNVWLYNATGTNVDNRPYVLYNTPLNPGQFVTLTLEFVVPDRRPFTNSLEVVSVLPVAAGTNSGSGVVIDRSFLDNRVTPARVLIEWTSIPGRTYTVVYSDDNMATWHAATPSVIAVNNRTLWYDDGPPKTATVPLSQNSRYYRVILAPLN